MNLDALRFSHRARPASGGWLVWLCQGPYLIIARAFFSEAACALAGQSAQVQASLEAARLDNEFP